MIRFSSSSDGYPYTFDQTLGLQADMTRKSITLIGIGDENGYTYSAPGTYTCEIWSNGKKLYSANFTVRAGTEIIFTYNGPPQGIDVKLYYNEELLGAIASENTIRKTIPSQGVFTFKAQLGDRIEELSLESRGSTTINVNIIARRTPSGIAFTEFIANRTPVEIRYVNIDYLNVRDRQNADAAELDVITQDTRVEILEEYMKSSWVRIKYYTNETGFVNGALLTSKQPPLVITSVKVGNGDYNGRWLTNAGDPLYSSQMRSLRPVVTYDAKFDGDVTFFVKIIHPNGEVEKLSSIPPDLPSGFSYSGKFHVENSNNQTLYLSNFGNSDKSIYQAGEWTVEIWYNNKQRLWSEKVTILP
jgi:hypothetical protein